MKHLRIMLIPLSLALLCSFGSEELQAKNKWKPANVELQDCSMVRLTYTAYETDLMAVLPEGYTPNPPPVPAWIIPGVVYVMVDITQCENIRIGEDWDVGGGTLYHEFLPFGVTAPDGESGVWGFPAAHTNPLAREAIQKAGMPCRPARDLWVEIQLDLDQGTVEGATLTDNLKPFGPNLFASFGGPVQIGQTQPPGTTFPPQFHPWKGGVTKLTWTVTSESIKRTISEIRSEEIPCTPKT